MLLFVIFVCNYLDSDHLTMHLLFIDIIKTGNVILPEDLCLGILLIAHFRHVQTQQCQLLSTKFRLSSLLHVCRL